MWVVWLVVGLVSLEHSPFEVILLNYMFFCGFPSAPIRVTVLPEFREIIECDPCPKGSYRAEPLNPLAQPKGRLLPLSGAKRLRLCRLSFLPKGGVSY